MSFFEPVFKYFKDKKGSAPSFSELSKNESRIFLRDDALVIEKQKFKAKVPVLKLEKFGNVDLEAYGLAGLLPEVEGVEPAKNCGYKFLHKVKLFKGAELSETWEPTKTTMKFIYKGEVPKVDDMTLNTDIGVEKDSKKGWKYVPKMTIKHPFATGEFTYDSVKEILGCGITHNVTDSLTMGATMTVCKEKKIEGGFGAKYEMKDVDASVYSQVLFKKEKEMLWKTLVQKNLNKNERFVGEIEVNEKERTVGAKVGYEKKFGGDKVTINMDKDFNMKLSYECKINDQTKAKICAKSDLQNNDHKFGFEISADF